MILITGGAGYIGSHINKLLNKSGYDTIVLDNLIKGHEEAVKWGKFVNVDLGDENELKSVFETYDIEAVMHFAAFSSVAESVQEPEKYFKNNYENTRNLLKVMNEFGVKRIIFSSTAALYGIPETVPIKEDAPLQPINPYGESKLMVENLLKDESDFRGLKYVSLRYFNAAGADIDCEIGENHNPESHLIPLVLDAAIGKRDSISIFGDDYNTDDGTCVRDYIHVEDLADAHLKALQYLEEPFNDSNVFNLGNGSGFSVKEVIDTCKKVTGVDFEVKTEGRREGDPDILIADAAKAREILKWEPKYPDLEDIVETAWNWHKKLNSNYIA
jgi:UDP-glucose 4-epimerase